MFVTKNVKRVRVEHANFDFNAPNTAAQDVFPVSNRYKENSFNEVRVWVFELVVLLLDHFVELEPLLLGVINVY